MKILYTRPHSPYNPIAVFNALMLIFSRRIEARPPGEMEGDEGSSSQARALVLTRMQVLDLPLMAKVSIPPGFPRRQGYGFYGGGSFL